MSFFEKIFGKKTRFENAESTITDLTTEQRAQIEDHMMMDIPSRESADMLGIPIATVYRQRKLAKERQLRQPKNDPLAIKREEKESIKLDFEIQKLKDELEMAKQEHEMRKLEFKRELDEWKAELETDDDPDDDMPDWLGTVVEAILSRNKDTHSPNTTEEAQPIEIPPVSEKKHLTDAEIKEMIKEIPKDKMKVIRALPQSILRSRASEMFPNIADESIDRAVLMVKA